MNYDIRRICNYFPEIHSRYYADTNGSIYTSLSKNVHRILVNGEMIYIRSFSKQNICKLNRTDKQIIEIPTAKNYYIMYDGTILQRLKTTIKENDVVGINLVCIDCRKHFKLSRLIAGCFIGNVENMEVHHKDRNRLNNKADNLEIMSFYEHRGKGMFNKTHNS